MNPSYPCLISGKNLISPIVRSGSSVIDKRALWMEMISASFPVMGAIIPPIPKASPIMRLETIDRPLGANS